MEEAEVEGCSSRLPLQQEEEEECIYSLGSARLSSHPGVMCIFSSSAAAAAAAAAAC